MLLRADTGCHQEPGLARWCGELPCWTGMSWAESWKLKTREADRGTCTSMCVLYLSISREPGPWVSSLILPHPKPAGDINKLLSSPPPPAPATHPVAPKGSEERERKLLAVPILWKSQLPLSSAPVSGGLTALLLHRSTRSRVKLSTEMQHVLHIRSLNSGWEVRGGGVRGLWLLCLNSSRSSRGKRQRPKMERLATIANKL